MRGAKFPGTGLAFIVGVLGLVLAMEVGLISASWAAQNDVRYGTAVLGEGIITNDEPDRLYIDYRRPEGGSEQIKGTFKKGEIERLTAFLGTYRINGEPTNERRVCMVLPALNEGFVDANSTDGKLLAFLKEVFLELPAEPYCDARARIVLRKPRREPDWNLEVSFMLGAITKDTTLERYKDAEPPITPEVLDRYFCWDNHLEFTFIYPSVVPGGVGDQWTITPPEGEVELVVYGRAQSKGRRGGGGFRPIVLATCESAPLELNVDFSPSQSAPRKLRTLSTLWGEIKSR